MVKFEITSVMIEGGAELSAEAIKEKIVDKILVFTAPKIIGSGLGAIGNLNVKQVNNAIKLKDISYKRVGRDLLVEGYL